MPRRRRTGWMDLAFDGFAAGLEAQQVIGLRLAKLALGGPAAAREARLMVDEKVSTTLRVQQAAAVSMMTGGAAGVPAHALSTYRRKMRANRRRLLREAG